MSNFEQERRAVELEIAGEIPSSVPSHWTEVLMDVRFDRKDHGTDQVQFILKGAPSSVEVVEPSTHLMEAVRRLSLLLQQNGKPCRRLVYTMIRTATPTWDFYSECYPRD